jgi:hypothetical protein
MKILVAVLGLGLLAGPVRAADPEAYLTKEGKLRHAVEFRDGQSGFAGVTGTAWKVEPDGSWTVSTFRNADVQKTLRRGKLTDRQLAALGHHLAALDVARLPRELGGFTGANPHVFSLRFGEHTATARTAPGQGLTGTVLPAREAEAWSRLVAAGVIVQRWTAEEGKP